MIVRLPKLQTDVRIKVIAYTHQPAPWLADSDTGAFMIRGQPVTIDYLQGGRKGQGRIRIEAAEVERVRELMRVRPRLRPQRRPPTRVQRYPGIYVELGDVGD